MKTYENDRIEVLTFLHVEVIIKLHDEDGHVEEIDFSIIESVKQENNKTLVRYFTDWEDDPIQGFYVQESVEEVENLLEEANKEYRNAFKNYKIVKNMSIIIETILVLLVLVSLVGLGLFLYSIAVAPTIEDDI